MDNGSAARASADASRAGLHVENLEAYYGRSQVLRDVGVQVVGGEVVSLVGRNGAGKTTTLKSIMALITNRKGKIRFGDVNLASLEPYEIVRCGIGYVPEGRIIFKKLTVEENLKIAIKKASPYQLKELFELFPRLRERRRNWGFQLSGGEQQMVAIARALAVGPRLVLLDEPSQGLAPVIVEDVIKTIGKIKEQGIAVLLVEQNIHACLSVADRFYVLDQGAVVFQGDNAEFKAAESVQRKYLTVDINAAP
jgi:branched-chain amino acid transport system ATP-binding protein